MKRALTAAAALVVLLGMSLGALGCHRFIMPDTVECQSCKRQCMMIYNQCIGSGSDKWACLGQEQSCFESCPGAYYE